MRTPEKKLCFYPQVAGTGRGAESAQVLRRQGGAGDGQDQVDRIYSMVLLLDGNSELVAHTMRKIRLYGKKNYDI